MIKRRVLSTLVSQRRRQLQQEISAAGGWQWKPNVTFVDPRKTFTITSKSFDHAFRYFSSTSDLTQRTSSEVRTSKDGVVGRPIDFDVNSKIEGNESQVR